MRSVSGGKVAVLLCRTSAAWPSKMVKLSDTCLKPSSAHVDDHRPGLAGSLRSPMVSFPHFLGSHGAGDGTGFDPSCAARLWTSAGTVLGSGAATLLTG